MLMKNDDGVKEKKKKTAHRGESSLSTFEMCSDGACGLGAVLRHSGPSASALFLALHWREFVSIVFVGQIKVTSNLPSGISQTPGSCFLEKK